MVDLAPEFPRDDFELGKTLLSAIGSFWSQIFADRARFNTELDGSAELFLQAQLNFLETVATVSRFETPVFHKERWRILLLRESALLPSAGILKYGDGAVYGPQPGTGQVFLYGVPSLEVFAFELPDKTLAEVKAFISNRIIDPSVVLTQGVDFTIDRNLEAIIFSQDPFKNELFSKRPIYGANNEIIDEEIALIIFEGNFDINLMFNHFGYAVDSAIIKSSQFYKDFINAFWNTFVRTPTLTDIRALLAAITGIPTVIENVETVEFLEKIGNQLQIITDKTVYKFKATVNPIVAVGDVLEIGDELVDSVKIIELSGSDGLPDIQAISLGKEFLSGGFFSQLIFEDRVVELDFQGIDNDNRTFVRFDLGGFPGDVDLFWDLAQARGKQLGKTLAELLDTRTNPPTDPSLPPEITQPGPEHLPLTINPLQFVIDNLLKNNMFIIKLKTVDTNPEALGLEFFHVMRSAIPPHTTFIVAVEASAPLDTIDLGQAGGDSQAGVQDDNFNFFDGPGAITEEIGTTPVAGVWIEEAMVRPRVIMGELL